MGRHRMTFTAQASHIDELGHVNNAVWVQWMETLSVAHWAAVASAEQQAAYVWVVARHEIDYRGNVGPGGAVTGETWIPGKPSGARFDRCVEFADAGGKVIVSARTTWALIDRSSGRLLRVPAEVAERFSA
jgi:acyl-CoA thioester hydrolase